MPSRKIADQVKAPTIEEVGLYINGDFIRADTSWTLLQTARANGVDIPTLCYHPDLPSEGHCRLCLVEVGEPPRTRLVNSCTFPVAAELQVQTHSERVLKARRLVLELLLARAKSSSSTRRRAFSTRSEWVCTWSSAATGKVQEFTSRVRGGSPTSTRHRRQWPSEGRSG